jgi:stage III sporulation protein AH
MNVLKNQGGIRMANRQTVWLSTMMILSLMLIGYYTVGQNIQPVPTTAKDTVTQTDKPDMKKDDVAKKSTDNTNAGKKEEASAKDNQEQTNAPSDYFASAELQEKKRLSEQIAELQDKIANNKTSAEEAAKAQKQMEELQTLSDKQDAIVEQIKAEGFPDAIVSKEDTGIYKVTVQAQDLNPNQVVKIMSIVKSQLNVPNSNVIVSYHP